MAYSVSVLGGVGWQFLNDDANPLAGGKLGTYLAGTTTPAQTFTDGSGATANPNPVILDSAGRPPEQIWLPDGVRYKFVLLDALDVVIRTYDDVYGVQKS